MLIKTGTVLELGHHMLACGDSTNKVFVQSLVGDLQVDAIVTDPPYAVAVVETAINKSYQHKKIANDQIQTNEEYIQFSKGWLEAIKEKLTNKNAFYIFNSDKMLFALKDALDLSDFKFAQLLIWVKNQPVIGRLDYLPMHELILYGWYKKHKFCKSKDKSVLFYPKPQKSKFHPTTKPVGLIRNLILNSTNINEVIYDPFLGSGTTLLACEQTHRKCIGIELDEGYCQTIVERWEKLTGLKATLRKEINVK